MERHGSPTSHLCPAQRMGLVSAIGLETFSAVHQVCDEYSHLEAEGLANSAARKLLFALYWYFNSGSGHASVTTLWFQTLRILIIGPTSICFSPYVFVYFERPKALSNIFAFVLTSAFFWDKLISNCASQKRFGSDLLVKTF